jgi:hypothetical protein
LGQSSTEVFGPCGFALSGAVAGTGELLALGTGNYWRWVTLPGVQRLWFKAIGKAKSGNGNAAHAGRAARALRRAARGSTGRKSAFRPAPGSPRRVPSNRLNLLVLLYTRSLWLSRGLIVPGWEIFWTWKKRRSVLNDSALLARKYRRLVSSGPGMDGSALRVVTAAELPSRVPVRASA